MTHIIMYRSLYTIMYKQFFSNMYLAIYL